MREGGLQVKREDRELSEQPLDECFTQRFVLRLCPMPSMQDLCDGNGRQAALDVRLTGKVRPQVELSSFRSDENAGID